jgi:hypothetical protein
MSSFVICRLVAANMLFVQGKRRFLPGSRSAPSGSITLRQGARVIEDSRACAWCRRVRLSKIRFIVTAARSVS